MTPLRAKMIDEMKLRRFAPSTQEAYVYAVEGLARFYNQSPDQIDQERILKYLLYLMEDRKLAWNTCNVVVSGIRFFYTNVLGMDSKTLIIPPGKKRKDCLKSYPQKNYQGFLIRQEVPRPEN